MREAEAELSEVEKEAEVEEESHAEASSHSEVEHVVDKVITGDAEMATMLSAEDSPVTTVTQAAVTELAESSQGEMNPPPAVVEAHRDPSKTDNETVLVTESPETTGDAVCETAIDEEHLETVASEKEVPETVSDREPPEMVGDRMSDNEAEASMDTDEMVPASHDDRADSDDALVHLQPQVVCDQSTEVSSDPRQSSTSLQPEESGLSDDNEDTVLDQDRVLLDEDRVLLDQDKVIMDQDKVLLDQDDQITESMSIVPEPDVPISAPQHSRSSVTELTIDAEDTADVNVIQDSFVSSNSHLVTSAVTTVSAISGDSGGNDDNENRAPEMADAEATSSATEELQVDVEEGN